MISVSGFRDKYLRIGEHYTKLPIIPLKIGEAA